MLTKFNTLMQTILARNESEHLSSTIPLPRQENTPNLQRALTIHLTQAPTQRE